MTIITTHSPTPWAYEYNPYTVQRGDAAAEELPAFEIFDAEQNKIFDTNEDMPSEIQEANARLASSAPRLSGSSRDRVLSCSPITTSRTARKAKPTGTRSPSSPLRRQERRNYEYRR